jgi:hypothetical protein
MTLTLIDLIARDKFEDWQKQIIFEKKRFRNPDSDEAVNEADRVRRLQDELHAAVEGGRGSAQQYLLEVLAVEDTALAARDVPHLPNPLTVSEMNRLPIHAECQLAKRLDASITPSQAAEPALWALCHAVWIGRGMFGDDLPAVFFEGPRGDTNEARTRNFLRRTGGLRHVRGNISPLVDCPISAAWWRYRLASGVSKAAEEEGEDISIHTAHEVLHHTEVWDNVVTMSLRQVTAVNSPRARAAVVVALKQDGLERDGRTVPQRMLRPRVQQAISNVARLSYGHSLEFVPWSQLVGAAEAGITNAIAGELTVEADDLDDDS